MQPGNQGDNLQNQAVDASPSGTDVPIAADTYPIAAPGRVISWQAGEYVHHEKERKWFILLFVGGLLLLAFALFLFKSWTFAILVAVMTLVLAVFAVRQPRIVSYQLTDGGIQINGKHFVFHDFRSFGVLQDGALYSVVLIPNKRFMPAVNLYFPDEAGDDIVALLGTHLPMDDIEVDAVDKLMSHLRF